jgi:methylamine dehydrogenase accessory protein MauD
MPIGWAITIVALWLAVIGLAVVMLGVLRQLAPALEHAGSQGISAADGPDVGSEIPRFAARTADGQVIEETQLRGQPTLLLFLSAGCGPCEALAQEMSETDLGALADEVIVVTAEEGLAELSLPAGLRIVAELAGEVSDALKVSGTPFAIAVDPAGIVRAKRVPNTVKQLRSIAAVLA